MLLRRTQRKLKAMREGKSMLSTDSCLYELIELIPETYVTLCGLWVVIEFPEKCFNALRAKEQ